MRVMAPRAAGTRTSGLGLRVDQAKAFPNPAFADGFRDLARNIQEFPALRHIEPELFPKGFHGGS